MFSCTCWLPVYLLLRNVYPVSLPIFIVVICFLAIELSSLDINPLFRCVVCKCFFTLFGFSLCFVSFAAEIIFSLMYSIGIILLFLPKLLGSYQKILVHIMLRSFFPLCSLTLVSHVHVLGLSLLFILSCLFFCA